MKQKIKLIFFHPYSLGGGSDNSLYRLISHLDKRIYDIDFVSINNSVLKEKTYNVNFIKLNATRTLFSIFELRNLIKKNFFYKKIILISNQNFANIISIFSIIGLASIKLIIIDRNHLDELKFYKNKLGLIKNKIIFILMKIFYKRANLCIGISKKLSKDLSKIIKCSVKTVYSPSYDKSIIKQAKIKNIKIKNLKKFIICVSRFSKRKGHETLIRAYSMLKNKKNYKLVLVGFGNEEENIKKMIKESNIQKDVIIINNLHNPFWLLKKASLSVVTSLYEGFPNVIVESLTLGTPVISTNMNAGASEILSNGKGGDLIKVGDYINLSKKIQDFINNPAILKQKLIFARKNLHRFDINTHTEIYNKIFKYV